MRYFNNTITATLSTICGSSRIGNVLKGTRVDGLGSRLDLDVRSLFGWLASQAAGFGQAHTRLLKPVVTGVHPVAGGTGRTRSFMAGLLGWPVSASRVRIF